MITVAIVAPAIQYAFVPLVSVAAFHGRIGGAKCSMNPLAMHDSGVVRLLRAGFGSWPFMHGRGWLLRASRLLLGRGPVRFHVGSGACIDGALDDWMTLWPFMRLHECDAPFQRSLAFLPHDGVAIDVGAHVGVWSLLAAARCPAARIHAFEPVPEIAARLRDHTRMNGAAGVVVNEAAAGAENGSRPFFAVREANTGASSFARRRDGDVELRVAVVALDDYAAQAGLEAVDLIKVDVEGAELLVFRGARRLLASERAPVVFFEIDDTLCAACGVTGRAVKQLLMDTGYGIYRWAGGRFSRVGADERHRHEDLFALKPRHRACLP